MPTLTDNELAKLRAAFDSCDSNRDGYIDRAEFHALLRKIDGEVSPAECELDLEFADTEGDGYIGFKEFVIWWTG